MAKSESVDGNGTIKWPAPPPHRLAEKLGGHTTSDRWLPEGVHRELDELRERHLAFRERCLGEIERLLAVHARFAAEEDERRKVLNEAVRQGLPEPVDDNRTPHGERVTQLKDAESRMWTAAQFLADNADQVIAWLREHEEELLAELRARHARAEQDYRDAVAAAKEKYAQAAWVPKLGKWLQQNCDDVGFGRQPVPPVGNAEDVLHPTVVKDALERPWHRVKPWEGDPMDRAARARGEAERKEMESADDLLAFDPAEDGPDRLIQPLDDDVRLGTKA